jgi:hypothetical protein
MSNRRVDDAAALYGGCGYIIVGAEPCRLEGVEAVDPAKLDDLVTQYVGSNGPPWSANYLRVDDTNVLVVTIEPPHRGDPLWPLRREFDGIANGTIFTRRAGKTVPADAAAIEMLGKRAAAGVEVQPLLKVKLASSDPLCWFDRTSYLDRLAHWALGHRDHLIQAAAALRDHPQQNGAEVRPDLPESVFEDESRTVEQYATELEKRAGRLVGIARASWTGWYCNAGHGKVHISIHQPLSGRQDRGSDLVIGPVW